MRYPTRPRNETDRWNDILGYATILGSMAYTMADHPNFGVLSLPVMAQAVTFGGLNEIVRETGMMAGRLGGQMIHGLRGKRKESQDDDAPTLQTTPNPWTGFVLGLGLSAAALTSCVSKTETLAPRVLKTAENATEFFMSNAENLLYKVAKHGVATRNRFNW